MAPKKKRFVRNTAICLITALLAGAALGSQSKVAQAKEVFLGVQKIRDEIIKDSSRTFTILEIVDETAKWGELETSDGSYKTIFDTDNFPGKTYSDLKKEYENDKKAEEEEEENEENQDDNEENQDDNLESIAEENQDENEEKENPEGEDGNKEKITAYDKMKQKISDSIRFGEEEQEQEELGYLIGDSEPFREMYTSLVQFSWTYSNLAPLDAEGNITTPQIAEADMEILKAAWECLLDKIPEKILAEETSVTPLEKRIYRSFLPNKEEYKDYLRFVSLYTPQSRIQQNEEVTFTGYLVEDPNGVYAWVGSEDKGQYMYVGDMNTPSLLLNYDFGDDEEESEEESDEVVDEDEEAGEGSDGEGTEEDEIIGEEGEEETPPAEEEEEETSPAEEEEEEIPPAEEEEETPPAEEEEEEAPPAEEEEEETPPAEEEEEETPPAEEEDILPTNGEEDIEDENRIQVLNSWKKEVFFGKQLILMSQNMESGKITKYSFHTIEEFKQKTQEELDEMGAIKVSTEAALEVDKTDGESIRKIDKVYQFDFVGIENNEWFKNHVFGLEAEAEANEATVEDLKIKVITTTPDDDELDKKIKQADLIYVSADSWKIEGDGADADVRKSNARLLLEKITDVPKKPCIVNYQVYLNLMKNIDGFTSLNEGHFVWENIYVINYQINTVEETKRIFDEIIGATQEEKERISIAFEDVDYRVEQERYEREQMEANQWPSNTPPTPALAIQTILTYTDVPVVIEKGSLTVLELQPCYSFTYAGNEEKFREKFLPKESTVELEIIGMTTAEFCGKIEDINVKYDMIYLGANTDLMNRMEISSGDYCTVYNDFNMYGIVYSHVGDLCHLKDHTGLLSNNECNTYRYSGNDILASQEEQLLDFLKSEAPIVVADDFFVKNQSGDITKINSGDTGATITDSTKGDVAGIKRKGILDSSTYIYQFVKSACAAQGVAYGSSEWKWENRNYKNFITAGEIEDEKDIAAFAKWLNQPKMTIHMMSQPTEYNYTTRSENGCSVIADSSYLLPESDGYYLTYEFSISNLASVDIVGTRYEALLWIDTNMDGKFSDNSENLSGNHFVVQNMETAEIVEQDDLKAGVHYRVRRELPNEIVGALPWKLVIRNKNNHSIRSAATGLTAIRMAEKPTIRVLQLYQGDSNIQQKMNQPDNVWNTLLSNVPDFKVEVTSIDATSYFNGTFREDLNQYDMLIVGFADVYQLSTDFRQERLDDIMEYANSGKCVLFSHDNTSWLNNKNNTLNMYIRDLTGLDRYGVTVYRTDNRELYQNKNIIKNGVSVPQSGLADSRQALKESIFDNNGMSAYKRDIAFAINTDQRQMDSRTQGITYSGNEHDRLGSNSKSDYITYGNEKYGDYYRYLNFQNAPMSTWKDVNDGDYEIEKNNEGAITEYPYRLKDKIDVASTHGQYYQLDLESDKDGDGEGDIVVWYTLNNSVKGPRNDIYDYSPNDVRNNYYIYNRGNITYTGMGHRTIQNEEEIKLFINTMVAAYRVSILPPTLNIIEGNGDNTKKAFDAIPVDMQIGNQTAFYKVYFKAQDINLVSDHVKKIRGRIYLEGGNQELTVNGESIKVTEKTNQTINGWRIFDTATNTEVVAQYDDTMGRYYYSFTSGKEYYVQVPLTEISTGEVNLSETKSMTLYIEVQSIVQKYGKTNISAYIYDDFKLNQINLFDLD